jgi:2-methylcitrate dehydratase
MDGLTRLIAEFASDLSFGELPEDTVQAATRYTLDSLACAIAAYDCQAVQIGRRLARGAVPGQYPGRILGFGEQSTAEAASFVNTAMIRDLDWNDTYPQGHPSDCLGALLAIAEAAGADGRRFLSSVVIAYELFIRLNDATQLAMRGWDQGYIVGVCAAAGIGHLLHLPVKQLGEAIAIVAVANVAMRNTRAGRLGLWKGAATAFANRNATFATLLAADGMTGADRPFEGKHGLMDLITGPFELEPLPSRGGRYRTSEVQLKYWPVEYQAQLMVWAALELRSKVQWQELESVDVGTYRFAHAEIGGEPEKWDPKTRETADHSLPYIFARTLVDGQINVASFEPVAYLDPSLRPLMAKIRVHVDDEVEALYPNTVAVKVRATTRGGENLSLSLRNPLGHTNNPMRDEDVSAKFLRASESVLGKPRASLALDYWWNVQGAPEMSRPLQLLDVPTAARQP